MLIVAVWMVVTIVGICTVAWSRQDARRVQCALTPGSALWEECRREVLRHTSRLVVLLLHLAVGLVVVLGQVVDRRWSRLFPLLLLAAEVVLVAKSVQERRQR